MNFSSGLAEALVSIGRGLPDTMRQRRLDNYQMSNDRFNRNRQSMLDEEQRKKDELARQVAQQQVAAGESEAQKRAVDEQNRLAAIAEYAKFRQGEQGLSQAQDIAGSEELTPESYMGPLNPGTMDELAKMSGQSRLERMQEADLPRMGAFDPGVKAAVDNEMADAKMNKIGGSGQASVYMQKKADLAAIRAMPEGPEKEQAFNDFIMNAATGTAYGLSDKGIIRAAQRSAAQASATSPIQTQTAANTEAARSDVEALTPAFIADRQKEWSAETRPYAEVIQNYAFAKSGAGGAIDDVALIKALEKVREPGSAVMFGDAEIWRKAGNAFDKAAEGGILDALKSGATKRLPDVYRAQLVSLLENAMSTARQKMEQKRQSYADVARSDYGWDDARVNRIYKIPSVSAGSDPTTSGSSVRPPLSSFKR